MVALSAYTTDEFHVDYKELQHWLMDSEKSGMGIDTGV